MDDGERQTIIARARRLATACGCCEAEIARRIGKKLGRSPATILHTLRKHDLDHPAAAIFPRAAAPITGDERARIIRLDRRDMPLRAIARRVCRSRSAVYRVLMDERIAKLNRRKARFIDDPLSSGWCRGSDRRNRRAGRSDGRACSGTIACRDLPPYLQDLYRTPLLSAAKERSLFLKFNFHKFQFVTARRKLEPDFARTRQLDALENHHRKAIETKNLIVRANLRLVVSVARKHLRPGLSLMELISEGNLVLMRAVEGFDLHRGYRFSTYATLALMKGFARSVPQMLSARSSGMEDGVLESLPDHRGRGDSDRVANRDQVNDLLTRLDERERTVLLARYGLGERPLPATFDEVGETLGLSKQRVRQIEKSAIAKLRGLAVVVVPPA